MMQFAVVLLGCTLLNAAYHFKTADGCSFRWPDACANVTCPNGQKCLPYYGYWCHNRIGGICAPRPSCDLKTDPCAKASCSSSEKCVSVIDQCSDRAGCTFKAQCNEIDRPGRCPSPDGVRQMANSCSNGCQDDTMCQSDTKCCPGGPFGKICVSAGFLQEMIKNRS